MTVSKSPSTPALYLNDGAERFPVATGNIEKALADLDLDLYRTEADRTVWLRFEIVDDEGEIRSSKEVALHPEDTDDETKHLWVRPSEHGLALFDVHGSGGGVVTTHVCLMTGDVMQRDSWGSPDFAPAVQGYDVVTIQRRKMSDEVAELVPEGWSIEKTTDGDGDEAFVYVGPNGERGEPEMTPADAALEAKDDILRTRQAAAAA